MGDLPQTIEIAEEGPREGFQIEKGPIATSDKIALIEALSATGLRHIQVGLVWLNLLFLMSISVLPFSCALLGHFFQNTGAQEIYFTNMFVAALLLYAQWILATRKKLIAGDDPRAVRAMGQQLIMFPMALVAALIVTPYRVMGGFNAMVVVLVGLRLWQRQSFRKEAMSPSSQNLSS